MYGPLLLFYFHRLLPDAMHVSSDYVNLNCKYICGIVQDNVIETRLTNDQLEAL